MIVFDITFVRLFFFKVKSIIYTVGVIVSTVKPSCEFGHTHKSMIF